MHPTKALYDGCYSLLLGICKWAEENRNRKGLKETGDRIFRSWQEILDGYHMNPKDVITNFEDEKEQYGGLVYLKNIEFYSVCEHHLLPFYGNAFIAYIPNGPVIGSSKLARILDIFSHRLQMQERIGEQVTRALMDEENGLNPMGAACLTEAKHLCIACRGVKKQHSIMGYSSLKGVFMEEKDGVLTSRAIAARAELMALWSK